MSGRYRVTNRLGLFAAGRQSARGDEVTLTDEEAAPLLAASAVESVVEPVESVVEPVESVVEPAPRREAARDGVKQGTPARRRQSQPAPSSAPDLV